MHLIRLIASIAAIIASCNASGVGHFVPAVKSFPIVRYAPFYNFPNGVRSIHAVAAPLPVGPPPAPLLPAPAPVPIFPAPAPAPVFAAPPPLLPAPAPIFSAPAPIYPAPAPVFPPPSPVFPPPAPIFTGVPAPFYPRIAPQASALGAASVYARAVPTLAAAPFSPIVRPVAAPVPGPLFAPAFAPAPVAVARAPVAISPYNPAPLPAAPIFRQFAWK